MLATDRNASLGYAELQYRLSLGISSFVGPARDGPAFDYYDAWSWGKHTATKEELQLNAEEEQFGAMLLRYSTLYLMMVQVDSALAAAVPNRFEHADADVRNAAWISRLIRNTFAHDPFGPTWQFYPECRNRVFEVTNVCRLNTSDLEGKPVGPRDYGGPLAALRLSQFVRRNLLGSQGTEPGAPSCSRSVSS